MNKNHCLARHIMDSSWSMFKQMLRYKVNRQVEVDAQNTSLKCSKCGNLVPKTLAIRLHECDRCGSVFNRDDNAALNILQKGMQYILLMQHGEVTLVETLSSVVEAGTSPHPLGVGS